MDIQGKLKKGSILPRRKSGAGNRPPESDVTVKKAVSGDWGLRRSKTLREKEDNGRMGMKSEWIEGRKSVSAVETNLGSVAAFLHVKILVADMPGEMQVHACRCARRTYDSLEKFSTKHMAYNLKKEFDRVYGPAWHCIVGSSFGSFVTHSTGCFLYFSMERLLILLFKTKVQRAFD